MIMVSIGAFFGAIFRFCFDQLLPKQPGKFPFSTFIVNSIGSFMLGSLLGLESITNIYLLIGVGFAGAFTTFSTFTIEVIQLFEGQRSLLAIVYITASVCIGLLFALTGYHIFTA